MMRHGDAEAMLAAGAALDDLDPDERAEYNGHRRACVTCRTLESDLGRVLADLPLAAPERTPPPALLDGIRREIAIGTVADRGASARPDRDLTLLAFAPATARPQRAHAPAGPILAGRRPLFAAVGVAAALAVAVLGVGARSVGLSSELEAANGRLAALQGDLLAQGAVMAVAVDPAHVTAALHAEALAPKATAVVLYLPGTSQAWLVAHDLPPTPSDHGYQLWYADDAGVHALGTYAYDGSGTFVAPFDVDLARSGAAMVTLEPMGGAVGDPGPQVVFGEL